MCVYSQNYFHGIAVVVAITDTGCFGKKEVKTSKLFVVLSDIVRPSNLDRKNPLHFSKAWYFECCHDNCHKLSNDSIKLL